MTADNDCGGMVEEEWFVVQARRERGLRDSATTAEVADFHDERARLFDRLAERFAAIDAEDVDRHIAGVAAQLARLYELDREKSEADALALLVALNERGLFLRERELLPSSSSGRGTGK